MIAQYFELVTKSIEENPRQSRLVITCFMACLKLVKGRGIELHQVVQSSCHILSDIKITDFILRKDLASIIIPFLKIKHYTMFECSIGHEKK